MDAFGRGGALRGATPRYGARLWSEHGCDGRGVESCQSLLRENLRKVADYFQISFVGTSALVLLPAGGERFRRNEVSPSRRAVGNLLGRDSFQPFQKERFANGADYFQKSFFGRADGLKRLAFSNGWSLDLHREYLHPCHRGHKFALKWPSRFLNTTE